jgi:hypothetical protein
MAILIGVPLAKRKEKNNVLLQEEAKDTLPTN